MKSVFSSCLALGIAATAAAQPNLLNNASFEDDLFFDFSDLSNWNVFADSFLGAFPIDISNGTGTTANTGDRALDVVVDGSGGAGGIVGAIQEVFGVVAGTEYELSAFVRSDGPFTGGQGEINMEWFNAAGDSLGTDQLVITGNDLTDTYERFAVRGFAPTDAVRVNAFLVGIVIDGVVNYALDDAALVVIPAPATGLAMLGMGGVVIVRRRR
ncbi:MAG: hypothetical protein AAGI30_00795 [Planctomycetota bacterium]